jgi:hypothetical protein
VTHNLLSAHQVRDVVWARQGGVCLRCQQPMHPNAWEAHHRRRRAVLGWCPCNVVGLHPRCHTQGPHAVHDHPELARALHLIVPTTGPEPFELDVAITWPWSGRVLLTCDGMACSPESVADPRNLP